MNLKPIARPLLLIALGCLSSCSKNDPSQLAPAAFAPPIDNDLNPPMTVKAASGVLGTVDRLDSALDALLPADAKAEVIVDGLQWAEGPVWYQGGLFFSDVPQNTAYRWTATKGVEVYLKPSGYTGTRPRGGEPGSNGLTVDHQGRLTLCQHGDRRVARLEKDGKTLTVLADHYQGKRFSSPNDLCYDANGNLYFTDPPYGLEGKDQDPKKEMDVNGVYLVRTSREIVRLNTGGIHYPDGRIAPLNFPNGVALSPDGKSLFVEDSDPENPVYLKYDVNPDGNVSNGTVFFDAKDLLAKKLKGLPDGMKFDTQGNLWATGPGGVLIFSPGGKHLGTILTGVPTANLAWGDDGSTLYICAEHRVGRIKTKVIGVMPGPSL